MAGTSSRRAGRAPTEAAAAALVAAVLLASLAPVDVALAADAGDAGVDMYGRPSLRKALTEVHRERANRFLAAALGSIVGLVGAGVLLSIWRRSPLASRIVATGALAVVTARFLGLYLIHERLNAPPVGALATWFFLAIMIPLVYRGSISVAARRSLPWLRVRARPPAKRAAEAERPTRPAADAADVAEAERVLAEALTALDDGDVAAAEAALRRSIEARPTKRARTYLGTLLGARGEGEAALAELDRALALDSSYSEALDERARVLRSFGREEEAEAARRALREARAGGPKRPAAPTVCPACGKEVEPGAARCECGTELDKCSRCGRGDVPLRAHEGELVCGRCRTREAAGHSKGPRRVEEAMAEGGPPPWLAAASFAGAVVVGAALSFVYVGWREFRAARELGAIARDAEAALSSPPGEGARPEALEFRRRAVAERDGFLRDRAATLKIALAVHGLARAEELAADEPALARVAREWAARRLTEARNSLEAGDREKLEEGFDKAYRSVVGSLDRLIERRRWLAADLARKAAAHAAPPAVPPDEVERDWRKVWRRPPTGTRFLVECFRRASGDDKAEVVGKHRDGSRLVAHGLHLCSVVEPRTRGGFAMVIEPVPYRVEKLGRAPGPYPPAVRLEGLGPAGRARANGLGPHRLEFGPKLEFLSLHQDEKGEPGLRATRESLFVSGKLPYPELPLFAPGIDEGWEQDEKLLWLYPDAEPTRGPCVRQLARWRRDDDGKGVRVGVRWHLRYMTRSRRSAQAIVQNWTAGRPWWNIYDDGDYFFRTRFDAEEEREE
ncbi:MAG: hypothetical protein ACYTKD_01905 [Planctomycetota bacterium]